MGSGPGCRVSHSLPRGGAAPLSSLLTRPTSDFRADWRSTVFLSNGFLVAGRDSGKKVKTWSCCRTLLCSSWKMAIRFPSLPATLSNWSPWEEQREREKRRKHDERSQTDKVSLEPLKLKFSCSSLSELRTQQPDAKHKFSRALPAGQVGWLFWELLKRKRDVSEATGFMTPPRDQEFLRAELATRSVNLVQTIFQTMLQFFPEKYQAKATDDHPTEGVRSSPKAVALIAPEPGAQSHSGLQRSRGHSW